MAGFNLDFSKFKKVGADKKTTTLKHEDGHEIKINHEALSHKMKQQLKKLPSMMAEGGEAEQQQDPTSFPDYFSDAVTTGQAAPEAATSINLQQPSIPEGLANSESTSQSEIPYDKLVAKEKEGSQPFGTPSEEAKQDVSSRQTEVAPEAAKEAPPAYQPNPTDIQQQSLGKLDKGFQEPTLTGGYEEERKGILQAGEAQAAIEKARAQAAARGAVTEQTALNAMQERDRQLEEERKDFIHDIQNNLIDPNHYMNSMSTGQKIGTAIGLILGGFGAMANQPNAAQEYLNGQIKRDIDAQEKNLNTRESLLRANLQHFGNLNTAKQVTQVMMHDIIANQLIAAGSKAQSPLAKANALREAGKQQQAAASAWMPFKQMQALQAGRQAGISEQDPATYVPFLPNASPADKAAIYKEIGKAQNVSAVKDRIMEAFDNGAKENTIVKTAGGLRTPPSIKALHTLMAPMFNEIDSTVRQAAMDVAYNNTTPAPGDLDSTIAIKRKALNDWMKSQMAAPVSKGHGLDLEKFKGTSYEAGARVDPKHKAYLDWAKAHPNNPKAAMVLKKLGAQ